MLFVCLVYHPQKNGISSSISHCESGFKWKVLGEFVHPLKIQILFIAYGSYTCNKCAVLSTNCGVKSPVHVVVF